MADRVHRVTMFKLPKPAEQQKLIEAYKTVDATNQKVRLAMPSPRASLVAVCIFPCITTHQHLVSS
jgi:hypothetical protein